MRDSSFWEDWLKDMVDDTSMSPSDKVWGNINRRIHSGHSRIYQFLIISALVFVFAVSWIQTGSFRIMSSLYQVKTIHNALAAEKITYTGIDQKIPKQIITNSKKKHKNEIVGESSHGIGENIPEPQIIHISNQSPIADSSLIVENTPTPQYAPIINKDFSKTISKADHPVKIDRNRKRLAVQFYMTPSVSYRIMTNQYILREGETLSERGNRVRHLPATGMEVGVGLIKPVGRRLSVKTGLQINFSRYQIKASETSQELVFVSTSPVSGFEQSSHIRNTDGNKPKKLMNENLQLSIPIGLDYQVWGKNKISLHIAGSVQPGFTIHASGYLITSNYKNYIQAEHLFRRLNIQSALESYVKIHAGSIDFHAGPQLRYQLLSNTVDVYPVKENLIDYGFKIGLIKHIR